MSRVFAVCMTLVLSACVLEKPFAPFVGVGAGFHFENFDDTPGVSVDDSVGVSARAGYRIIDLVAVELQYDDLGEFDFRTNGRDIAELDGWALTVNGKLYPLSLEYEGPVEPYWLVGVGVADMEIRDVIGLGVKADDSGTIFKLGVGVDSFVNQHVGAYVESTYVLTGAGDLHGSDYYTANVGLLVRF